MSQKELIKFTCPHCETRLTVPASLGGIVGPCPKCVELISAPKPRVPSPAKIKSVDPPPVPQLHETKELPPFPQSRPYTRQKSSWIALIIPLSFLVLTIGVIFSVSSRVTPQNSVKPPHYSESARPIQVTQSEQPTPETVQPLGLEVELLEPDIALPPPENEKPGNAELLLKAREVLAAFLEARDLSQRRPLLTPSNRSSSDFALGILASSLPDHLTPDLIQTRSNEMIFEAYFSIVFIGNGDKNEKSVIIQIVCDPISNKTMVNTDAFLDSYQETLLTLSQTPTEKIEATTCLISYANFSFDDIPFSDKMALIEFHTNFAKNSPPLAKAYVARNSDVFLKIKDLGIRGEVIPCSMTLGWELQMDPERPFLKVLHLDSSDWTGQ